MKAVEAGVPKLQRGLTPSMKSWKRLVQGQGGEQEVERMNNQVIGEFSLGYWLRRVWIQ